MSALPLSLLLPLLALAGALLPAPSHAAAVPGPVRLELLDRDTGTVLPRYDHAGEHWVAGERGHRYAVRLHNTSRQRVLVVLSVDGINAISGETADPGQTGYVLAAGQSTDIAGWRKSSDEIAQFVFSNPADSYGARTGRADNLGAIGVAVFTERAPAVRPSLRVPAPRPAPVQGAAQTRAEQADAGARLLPPSPPAPAPAPVQRLGTGHGEREYAPVRDTTFLRSSATPVQLTQLRYDSARTLRARGIVLRPVREERTPQAFPRQYVPDPAPR